MTIDVAQRLGVSRQFLIRAIGARRNTARDGGRARPRLRARPPRLQHQAQQLAAADLEDLTRAEPDEGLYDLKPLGSCPE
jgi:hypothetical protein